MDGKSAKDNRLLYGTEWTNRNESCTFNVFVAYNMRILCIISEQACVIGTSLCDRNRGVVEEGGWGGGVIESQYVETESLNV